MRFTLVAGVLAVLALSAAPVRVVGLQFCSNEAVACTSSATGCAPGAFINEFRYRNIGGEFVEVFLPAGADPSNYKLVLYNGANGREYGDTPNELPGTPSTTGPQYVLLTFTNVIQNGPRDGMALTCGTCCVIEFISYEGIAGAGFTATDGPADGLISTDVGKSEPQNAALGTSIQRTGTIPRSFTWATVPSATWTVDDFTKAAINSPLQSVAPIRNVKLYQMIRQPQTDAVDEEN